jgi:dipeptidase E
MKHGFGRKRNLVLYSGGNESTNQLLHKALVGLQGLKARSFTYVPFSQENGSHFFTRIKKRYSRFGVKKFVYFAVDAEHTQKEMRAALRSDIIYLAGGNTFYFLKHLRESGFLKELTKQMKNGKSIAGLSAGALILTPTIYLAGYPKHDCDLNEVRLKNLKSIGATDFEFFPHYVSSVPTNKALLSYSRRNQRSIYACPDGSGIVVRGIEMRFIGPVFLFHKGQKIKVN